MELAEEILEIIKEELPDESVTIQDVSHWLVNQEVGTRMWNTPAELASLFMEQY